MLTSEQHAAGKEHMKIEFVSSADAVLDETNYREAVETLMRLRSDKAIGNSLPSHAAILFEAFFRNAQGRVRIFCQNLNNHVFGINGVVESATIALNRKNVGIDILIQDATPDSGPFLKFLQENRTNPLLRLRRVDKETTRSAPINFSIMDNEALRYEKDREKVKAFAIMFAPNLAGLLIEKYEKMFAASTPLQIPIIEPDVAI